MTLRLVTAGESHGEALVGILEGVPAGLRLSAADIDPMLERRQRGYGRGGRMKIERDRVEIPAGLRAGRTLGTPLALLVRNLDATLEKLPPVTRPRPGHADLPGMVKMGTRDARDILERASARSTALLVAAGAVAATFLREFGVEVAGYTTAVGEVRATLPAGSLADLRTAAEKSDFLCPDPSVEAAMRYAVDAAKEAGDTLGGVVAVRADGVPPGLGDFRVREDRLDGRLAAALMSLPAVKAVEIGEGIASASRRGTESHDAILPAGPEGGLPLREGNRAGGIEGGMTNGEPILVTAWMKPLSSVRDSLPSVDSGTGGAVTGARQRSDVCAVPALSVVAEAAVALEIARVLLEKTGGDTLAEVRRNLDGYLAEARRLFPPCPPGTSSGGATTAP